MFLIYELMAQPALGHAIAVGLFAGLVALGGVALSGGCLWNLRLITLAGVVLYILGGLLFVRSRVGISMKRCPLHDGLMAGLFCGFILSLGAITFGLVDPGLI